MPEHLILVVSAAFISLRASCFVALRRDPCLFACLSVRRREQEVISRSASVSGTTLFSVISKKNIVFVMEVGTQTLMSPSVLPQLDEIVTVEKHGTSNPWSRNTLMHRQFYLSRCLLHNFQTA